MAHGWSDQVADGVSPGVSPWLRDISGALEFFTIFSAVGTLYSGLQLWINSSAFDRSDLATVHQMEGKIVALRHTLLPILDLNKWVELAVVALLVLLAVISTLARLRMMAKAKLTLGWLRRAYIILTILGSFTFSGSAVAATSEQGAAEIKAKIEDVKPGSQSYEVKLERIARRVVCRSLARTGGYAGPVERFDKYVHSRNRAIDRARSRPHNELITFQLDACLRSTFSRGV